MKSIKAYRKNAAEDAKKILESGMSTLSTVDTALKDKFPYGPGELSKAELAFQAEMESNGLDQANPVLAAAIPATRDLVNLLGVSHLQTMERFISLHVPKMEDGNNFGVTVQMTIAKHLKEQREEFEKALEIIPKYYSTRADAVEKLGLAKSTSSETKTTTKSESTGGKDGDENKQSTNVVTEEKTSNGSKVDVHRARHVAAIDVQCYAELQRALVSLMDGYATILDNMEKNKEKLEKPKGDGHSGGGFQGMY